MPLCLRKKIKIPRIETPIIEGESNRRNTKNKDLFPSKRKLTVGFIRLWCLASFTILFLLLFWLVKLYCDLFDQLFSFRAKNFSYGSLERNFIVLSGLVYFISLIFTLILKAWAAHTARICLGVPGPNLLHMQSLTLSNYSYARHIQWPVSKTVRILHGFLHGIFNCLNLFDCLKRVIAQSHTQIFVSSNLRYLLNTLLHVILVNEFYSKFEKELAKYH